MRYTDNLLDNEAEKVVNGERDSVTLGELQYWLGSDNTQNKSLELILDILNYQYPVDDCVRDIRDINEDLIEAAREKA